MAKALDNFKSTLIVQLKLKSQNEIHLDSTSDLITTENLFALNNGKLFVEYAQNKLKIYRMKPNSLIKEISCSDQIQDMIFVRGVFAFVTESLLCVSNEREVKRIHGDFRESRLLPVDTFLGIQFLNKLVLYDLEKILNEEYKSLDYTRGEFPCSESFYLQDVLLISSGFLLTVIIKGRSLETNCRAKLTVNLPKEPTCLVTDLLFTRVYCGTETGDVLVIYFDGTPNRVLEYHKSKVVSLKFSFCNRFLYSADSSGVLCVWDVDHHVVIDKIEVGSEIYRMESSLTDCVSPKVELPAIFKK